ncbi:MAG: hypothetical protein KAZ37_01975 [Rhodocyclaceae bacterium]|jgi:hypothetical protein|uniref:Uncharacterized protein n=2 Tax=Fluviibacter phosphoraccumulans TaxID=1751046 RepID=A0A679I6V9_9RHOO|nr:hypothetical protein [Fluviibacter phosphoraccumulans]MBP7917999.1 hypothetical protein [Rhodocyclaceae bacterium]HBI83372.1 hypothetical protein [Alcaligenaceae bacterium]MBP7991783.1 hypothetical protein [Rhodocyclaceae bacterium]BBU68536.1 hypothetical protein ICHIAU1_08190 [Fluviibacter phosphoraccumulans]BBU72309.1 hypothetical protein ICHIJ1_22280 [Fluviibacter phosphoraccumulans]
MNEFAHRLYLTNIPPEVTEAEIRALVFKYTRQEPVDFKRVDEVSEHPVYVLSFNGLLDGELQEIVSRLHDLYWHEHHIVAHVI